MKLRMIALPVIAAVAVAAAMSVTGCGQQQQPSSAGVPALQEVDSTTFSHVGYDPSKQLLTIVFRDGGETYVYKGISAEVYQGLLAAESLGSYYHENIRDKFEYDRK